MLSSVKKQKVRPWVGIADSLDQNLIKFIEEKSNYDCQTSEEEIRPSDHPAQMSKPLSVSVPDSVRIDIDSVRIDTDQEAHISDESSSENGYKGFQKAI